MSRATVLEKPTSATRILKAPAETLQATDAFVSLFCLRGCRRASSLYPFDDLISHLGRSLVAVPGQRFAARDQDACLRVEDRKSVEEAYRRSPVELNLKVGEFFVVDYSQPQGLILGPLADLVFKLRRLEKVSIGCDKDGSN